MYMLLYAHNISSKHKKQYFQTILCDTFFFSEKRKQKLHMFHHNNVNNFLLFEYFMHTIYTHTHIS